VYQWNTVENEINPDDFGLGNAPSIRNAFCSADEDYGLLTGGIAEARRSMLRMCARHFVSTPGYMLSSLTGL
jgi:hypothetical protein